MYEVEKNLKEIVATNNDSFSFVDILGSFLQNASWNSQFNKFQTTKKPNDSETFIYSILSAASDDIGQTIYDNVKEYIHYVADVDVCKIRSLKSMLKLLGFNYTLFDKFENIPIELLDLINILSISRKFLLKNNWMKSQFLSSLYDNGILTKDDEVLNLKHFFKRNSYILSSCSCLESTEQINSKKILGAYQQLPSLSIFQETKLSAYSNNDTLSNAVAFKNNYGFLFLDRPEKNLYSLFNQNLQKIFDFNGSDIDGLQHFGDISAFQIEQLQCDPSIDPEIECLNDFVSLNKNRNIAVQLTNFFKEDTTIFDDSAYQQFVENIFSKILSGFVLLPYNTKMLKNKAECQALIYPDLGKEYYRSFTSLRDYLNTEDDLLSLRNFYHVPKTFNASFIVDEIDNGNDQLTNYSGAQLSILQYEIEKRSAPLSLSAINSKEYSIGNTSFSETRYSFYRKKKVLEYAKFIDDYYSQTHKQPIPYDFDPNYYVVSCDASNISTVISQTPSGNPDIDIDGKMIEDVAFHLAKLVIYIQKIREKIKQQTQKNYMKGTNLLLIYIINEYLLDYANQNQTQFFDAGLTSIYEKLSAHQFKESEDSESYTINAVEYYDETEYFNISSSSSISSNLSGITNPQYWISNNPESKGLLKDDGLFFSVNQIENFYLSVLNLNSKLSGNLPNFLSTIFNLGADPTFIFNLSNDSTLSIYSSVLSTGSFASEKYQELISLSNAWEQYKLHLDEDHTEYKYPTGNIATQLSDSLYNGIFVQLSSQYLSSVSTAYNTNIQSIINLSSSVVQLSNTYNSFITSEYSFYYKKFEDKHCYDDFDPDTGSYKHNWYISNPKYDTIEMNLHEHLYQLDQYSQPENIVNWALSDIILYVEDNFVNIQNKLKSDVVQKLIADYGFVDINALTLDSELDYTYNFLNDLTESRKTFLKDQLASIQQQATNLKTSYESLNNTFTNAVATFQDNNAGYNLGDNKIFAVSIGECPSGLFENKRCTRNDSKPSAKAYKFVLNIAGYWYYGKDEETESGSYAYEEHNISQVYSPTDSLQDRCDAVKEYMATPTHFAIKNKSESDLEYFYGLQNEGIAAVADNTIASLNSIKNSYDSICGTAAALFGINVSSTSLDLYQNILELVETLLAVDESFFDDDANLNTYKGFLKTVIDLSASYLPVKAAFDSIFKSTELASYMINFIVVSDLTYENIKNIKRYLIKTDTSNLKAIRNKINEFYNEFSDLLKTKDSIELCMFNSGISSVTFTTGNNIETYIYNLKDVLEQDLIKKTTRANSLIDIQKLKIHGYCDIISNEISTQLNDLDTLDSAASGRIQELNFFENEQYKKYKDLFLTYGGQSFCYDPYYNMKNDVHPSYQIHPYLWNFVKKLGSESLVQSGFQTKSVNELEEDLVNSYIKNYINEFGMPINVWMQPNKGLIDYTGYLTRYEMSENYSPATGFQNEVVDYDGAFYPPAISDFRLNKIVCINSVSSQVTKTRCLIESEKSLPTDITSLLDLSTYSIIDENTDEEIYLTSVIGEHLYQPIYDTVSKWLDISRDDLKTELDKVLVGQLLSDISESKIFNVLNTFYPITFFEKYYKHLDLPSSEYIKIANQLSVYSDKIFQITNPSYITDVYDIYKYGLDINGNSYILYKQYDYSTVEEIKDLSFKSKRDTLGEMWIRLANNPIAFPAFSGQYPMYYVQNPKLINTSILSVAAHENKDGIIWTDKEHTSISYISSDMKVFYDFEIASNKQSISYITINADFPISNEYKRFDLSWVIGTAIQSYYDQVTDLEWLQILNDGGSGIERIDFNYNSSLGQYQLTLDDMKISSVIYPGLIGYYPIDDSAIDFVYLSKSYGISSSEYDETTYCLSSEVLSSPEMFVIRILDGVSYTKTTPQIITDLIAENQKIIGDTACIGFDNDQHEVILATTTQTIADNNNLFDVEPTSSQIDFLQNSNGPVIDDPTSNEMNSHDYNIQNVSIAKFLRKSQTLKFKGLTVYNLNADISYIPAYPSLSNESRIFQNWPDKEYHCIELLGVSKDIDSAIKLVNPEPDPYLDYDSIVENQSYGRVYEDYNKNDDKTFKLINNPSLHSNSPLEISQIAANRELKISYSEGDDYLEYSICLAKLGTTTEGTYNENDYKNLKLLVYNRNTLGKNPYLICDLNSLNGITKEVSYNHELNGDEIGEIEISTSSLEKNEYYAVGTHDSFQLKTKTGTNGFSNISKITASFNSESSLKILSFKFYIQDKSFPFKIPASSFSVLLHNPYDLNMFKHYHLIDAYGAVNCKYLVGNLDVLGMPDDGRGWGIYYDPSKFDMSKYMDASMSYVVDDSGLITWLKDIELSDYNYLSDVYVLSGYKGLGFKYDEELRFAVSSDLYYYPTMNLSYPKQAADYVNSGKMVSKSTLGELSVLDSLFTDKNLFVLDLDDPNRIANKIGNVAIPVLVNDVDDVRAFEDWHDTSSFISTFLSNDVETTITVDLKFSEIYDPYDPRAFSWVKFASDADMEYSDGYQIRDEFPMELSSYDHKPLTDFLDECRSKWNLIPVKSEELTSDYQSEYVFVDINSSTVDLSRMLKLYVNYRKNPIDNTLDLYFNYFNWFDTPYIKIKDNKSYIDTIENTYLKLEAGKDGFLDIIVQIKYYNGEQLCGYKNIKVLSYHIQNLSDDKPKFLIRKVYEIQEETQGIDKGQPLAILNLNSLRINLDDYNPAKQISMPVWFNIGCHNAILSSECEFLISYPDDILGLTEGTYGNLMVNPIENGINGLNKIHIYNTNIKTHKLPFYTKLKASEMIATHNNSSTYITIEEPILFDKDGNACKLEYNDCTISFKSENYQALAIKGGGISTSGNKLILTDSFNTEKVILTQVD